MMNHILECFDTTWARIEPNPIDGNCVWMKQLLDDDKVLYISPSARPVGELQSIDFMSRLSSKTLSEPFQNIYPRSSSLLPAIEIRSFSTIPCDKATTCQSIHDTVIEIIKWAKGVDLTTKLQAYLGSRPDRPLIDQIWHLAILAEYERYEELMEYQSKFQTGNHLNFLPAITKEIIDNATIYSVRNL